MNEFFVNFLFGCLGALLPIGIRALNHAGTRFSLMVFAVDNGIRFCVLGGLIAVVNVIVIYQPEFVEALKSFGLVIPAAVSSVVGFALAVIAVKTIPTVAAVGRNIRGE